MKKKFLSLGTAFLMALAVGTQPLNVFASEKNVVLQYEDSDIERATGLISKCSLSITAATKSISINAQTKSNSIMSSIGFINISVQRSSDGISWTEERSITDQLGHNTTSKSLSGYIKPVTGGYYYCVQLEHYADNGSGTTQSVTNTSNIVWVS